jgi:hypothetical protein
MNSSEDQEFIDSVVVVAGEPNEEELAAVMAVLMEARRDQRKNSPTAVSSWSKNNNMLRNGILVGNGQWGSSYKTRP